MAFSQLMEKMAADYIDAMRFTDTADHCLRVGNDGWRHTRVTNALKDHAFDATFVFISKCRDAGIDVETLAADFSLGADIWYARNGHGVCFLDRVNDGLPKNLAESLNAVAAAMGEVYTYYVGGHLSVDFTQQDYATRR